MSTRSHKIGRALPNNPSEALIKRRKKQFLAGLQEHGTVAHACDHANISRSCAYSWRDRDADFQREWNEIIESQTDALEEVARQRATNGSDILLMFLLNARRPDTYVKRTRHEITGGDKPLINIQLGSEQRQALSDALRARPAIEQDNSS